MPSLRLSPSTSITLGLVSLILVLYTFLDVFVGLVPNEEQTIRQVHDQVSSNLALELGTLLRAGQTDTLTQVMRNIQSHDDDILSIGIRDANGKLIAQSGIHWKLWIPPPENRSTINRVRVPLFDKKHKLWVTVEVNFRQATSNSILSALKKPSIALPLSIVLGGSVLFYLYLHRVLQHLDPSKVIPGRVSTALDTLIEGVIIFDTGSRIMLVNESIKSIHPEAEKIHIGQKSETLDWLCSSYRGEDVIPPWKQVLQNHEKITGQQLKLAQGNGKFRKFIVNASPIHDGEQKIRGCLVTFQDITRQELIMAKLRASQEKIQAQNKALQHLANYDQLTQLLNRRAFYEQGEKLFKAHKHSGKPLAFIMCDIDHFKAVNDNYGHPVGDEAIRVITTLLRENVRSNDVIGRYGGEEFCILVPGLSPATVATFAENLRAKIDQHAGPSIKSVPGGLKLTSSFGVSILSAEVGTLDAFIEQGDQALYVSKENGRNIVSFYGTPPGKEAVEPLKAASAQVV